MLQWVSSFIKDTLASPNTKYRVRSLEKVDNQITVFCEACINGKKIEFNLIDIMQDDKLKFFSSNDIILLTNAFNQNFKVDTKSFISSKYYHAISMWFVICFIVSNIAALKICNFFGYFQLDAGTLTFPLLYVLNDIITEVYGFAASRKTIYTALCGNCLVMGFLYLVTLMPNALDVSNQNAFEQLFFLSPRIVVASILSFLIGELINSTILLWLKAKLNGKFFSIRAIISTFIGSLTESTVFCHLAFAANIEEYELIKMITVLTLVKVIYEIIIMPVTIKFIACLKNNEKRDAFENISIVNFIPKFFKTTVNK